MLCMSMHTYYDTSFVHRNVFDHPEVTAIVPMRCKVRLPLFLCLVTHGSRELGA